MPPCVTFYLSPHCIHILPVLRFEMVYIIVIPWVCLSVRGDNPGALANGLSYVQGDNPWYI